MARSNYLLLPGLTVFALFSACGGSGSDTLDSTGGGASAAAGSSSVAGDSSAAGDNSGTESAGATGSGEAGFSGADEGQAGAAGEAGQTGSVSGGAGGGGGTAGAGAGAGAGGSAGHAGAGGSAGHGGGGAGSGGTSMGGSHSGGSAGSGPPEPTCAQLDTEAQNQLGAAQACNSAQGFNGCDARVTDTCGCQVPVESTTSAASKTYLATLKTIAARKCARPVGCHACVKVNFALCSPSGKGNAGKCVNFAAQ
jgi:hypothetical protein